MQTGTQVESGYDWRVIDRALVGVAQRRAALDVEEARWLREAERMRIWREVGCVSLLEYMERRLGYGPRAAQERLRVALALEEVPQLEDALEAGELPFSAVRELTRVATAETAGEWLEVARGKTVLEIQERVAGRKKGDVPGDPARPEEMRRRVSFEVKPATYALLRQAQAMLEDDRGEKLDEDQLIEALATAVIEGARGESKDGEHNGRAKYQVIVSVCPDCEQAKLRGAGVECSIDAVGRERAECDAQRIDLRDGERARAAQDVPPATRRFVFARDRDRCAVPGCRSKRCLELHHLLARLLGGTHDEWNLIVLCGGHHQLLHEGKILIEGRPGALTVVRVADAN